MGEKDILMTIVAVLSVFVVASLFSQVYMMPMAYGFSGMWIFGWLFMTLIIIVLSLLIMWLIQNIKK